MCRISNQPTHKFCFVVVGVHRVDDARARSTWAGRVAKLSFVQRPISPKNVSSFPNCCRELFCFFLYRGFFGFVVLSSFVCGGGLFD